MEPLKFLEAKHNSDVLHCPATSYSRMSLICRKQEVKEDVSFIIKMAENLSCVSGPHKKVFGDNYGIIFLISP